MRAPIQLTSGIARLYGVYVPFSLYCPNFMCPSMWKREKWIIFMCLLEFECIKRLKAHSQAIPGLVIGDGNSTSVYNYSKYLTSSHDWNRATDCNNKPTRWKWGEKIAKEKYVRKATWNRKILKNKSKDRDSNFLVVFSSRKAWRAIERGEGMTHWC